eukprot:TRINITY_DN8517_c0_g2_i1.p1 TRINITY_DN8517_c0_g2~~TRINITY_DN8517_c0_g2_i1.p1  ORF type:complete len:552 (+),score=97.46 TRINITY_DN8517_c0_g2_i1:70-1656(+)
MIASGVTGSGERGRGHVDGKAATEEEEATSLRLEIQALQKIIADLQATVVDPRTSEATPIADVMRMGLPQLRQELTDLEKVYERLNAREAELKREFMLRSKFSVYTPKENLPKRITSAGDRLTIEEIEAIDDPYCLLGLESTYMMTWNTKYVGSPTGPRDEKHRRNVREGTKRKVVQELGLSMFGAPAEQATILPPMSEATCLFLDGGVDAKAMVPGALPGGQNLLGRYDIVVIRACADFDNTWAFTKGARNDFFVGHAAAINIGESREASDFFEFCRQDNVEPAAGCESSQATGVICQLDMESYVEAMGRIIDNLVQACASLQIEHLVFFPFGMGAFLRHLGKLDDTFADDMQLQRLRRCLARRFVHALASAPPKMQIHLCLRFQEEESQRNADAFLRALVDGEAALVRSRLSIWADADSMQVSTDLAAKSRYVMLVNGANRRLLGNHWFAGRATMAIDENLHRRSWRMSALAYLLNGFDGQEPAGRPPNQLEQAVLAIRGRVCDLHEGGRVSTKHSASSVGRRRSR